MSLSFTGIFRQKKIFLFLVCVLATSCFGGVDKRGSVHAYSKGVVFTEGGSFRVGPLSRDWLHAKFPYRSILFANRNHFANISIDSFCKGSFDDASLPALSRQLFYNMTGAKQHFQKKIILDGREGLRTRMSGLVDGEPVLMDAVVLKMNECVFDFAYVTVESGSMAGIGDFEKMVEGFRYIKGPGD